MFLKNQDCTIIILSYNTNEVTDICLKKAEASKAHCEKNPGNSIKIVVVDNGSHDGSVEMIRKKHPETELISLPENIGYPKGNNLAMKDASTPFILLLNDDAYLNEDTIQRALEFMDRKQPCDALCVRLTYPDGGFQPFGGSLPTPLKTIFWNFGLGSAPIIKHFISPIYQYDPGYFKKEQRMEWCSTGFF